MLVFRKNVNTKIKNNFQKQNTFFVANKSAKITFQGVTLLICKIKYIIFKMDNHHQKKVFVIGKNNKRISTTSIKRDDKIQMNYEIKTNTVNDWQTIDNMSHPRHRIDLHFHQQ